MKNILILLIMLSNGISGLSQLRFYSDAHQNLAINNPAMAGHDGQSHLRFGYYNQFFTNIGESNLKNGNFQFDKGVKFKKASLGFSIGSGMGVSGPIKSLSGYISLAYHLQFGVNENSKQSFSFGLKLDQARLSLNNEGLRWPSQIDPNTGFDPNIPHDEDVNSFYHTGIDIGGLYSYTGFGNQKMMFGLSVQDVNKSDVSYTLSFLGRLLVTEKLFMEPQAQYYENINGGIHSIANNFTFNVYKRLWLITGFGYSKYDNYRFIFGVDVKKIRAEINYCWRNAETYTYFSTNAIQLNLSYRLSSNAKKS